MENAPGTPWRQFWNSMAPIPLYFFIKSSLKTENQWKMRLDLPEPIPWNLFIQSLLTVNGKCSWSSLGQFLCTSSLNLIGSQWKMVLELPGPIP